jgi:hypothetical protein
MQPKDISADAESAAGNVKYMMQETMEQERGEHVTGQHTK